MRPRPAADEVHIVFAPLDPAAPEAEAHDPVLSGDERARADRLLDIRKRGQFIAGRRFLRQMLGHYLDMPPESIRFAYGAQEKPFLPGEPADGIRFNLSHADDRLLLALTRGREVGVDLERVRDDLPFRGIVERFFTVDERDRIDRLPPERQLAAFYRCWTRKEARLKASGTGFSTSGREGSHDAALPSDSGSGPAPLWCVAEVPVPPPFLAAVAVAAGPDEHLIPHSETPSISYTEYFDHPIFCLTMRIR